MEQGRVSALLAGTRRGGHREPTLQIFALGMGDGDGVVGGCGQGRQEGEADLGLDGGGEEDLAEELGVDRAAAAESEEEAARGETRGRASMRPKPASVVFWPDFLPALITSSWASSCHWMNFLSFCLSWALVVSL